jgi:hypothetical protein
MNDGRLSDAERETVVVAVRGEHWPEDRTESLDWVNRTCPTCRTPWPCPTARLLIDHHRLAAAHRADAEKIAQLHIECASLKTQRDVERDKHAQFAEGHFALEKQWEEVNRAHRADAERVAVLEVLLRDIEWSGLDDDESACPWCRNWGDPESGGRHRPECELAAALAAAPEPGAGGEA